MATRYLTVSGCFASTVLYNAPAIAAARLAQLPPLTQHSQVPLHSSKALIPPFRPHLCLPRRWRPAKLRLKRPRAPLGGAIIISTQSLLFSAAAGVFCVNTYTYRGDKYEKEGAAVMLWMCFVVTILVLVFYAYHWWKASTGWEEVYVAVVERKLDIIVKLSLIILLLFHCGCALMLTTGGRHRPGGEEVLVVEREWKPVVCWMPYFIFLGSCAVCVFVGSCLR